MPNLASPILPGQQNTTQQTIAYTLQNVQYSVSFTFTDRDIMDLNSTQVSAALLDIPVIGTSLWLDGFDGAFFDAFMGPIYAMLTVLPSWNFSESGLNLS